MPALYISFQGQAAVRENIERLSKKAAKGVEAGLVQAGLHLQAMSQEKVPVEFGNLKASAYTVKKGSGFNTVVEVGYTAFYALFVHEKVGMILKGQARKPSPPHMGSYWDPQGAAQAKFLEQPARTEIPKMLQIIKKAAKVAP